MSLRLRNGGLGVRSPTDLAMPCFTSSVIASRDLCNLLLPDSYHATLNQHQTRVRDEFCQSHNIPPDTEDVSWVAQGSLDRLLSDRRADDLLLTAVSDAERAQLLAGRDRFSYRWLEALPCA